MSNLDRKKTWLSDRLEVLAKVEHTPARQKTSARIMAALYILVALFFYSNSRKTFNPIDVDLLLAALFAGIGVAFLFAKPDKLGPRRGHSAMPESSAPTVRRVLIAVYLLLALGVLLLVMLKG